MFKACSVAIVALTGCGGGGGNATSLTGASTTATDANPSAAVAQTSLSTSSSPAASASSSSSGGATTGSADNATGPATNTEAPASISDSPSETTSGTSLAALAAAPASVSVSATPASTVVGLNGTLKLAVSATSTANLSYQWRRNGQNLNGETARTLERTLGASDAGARFDVVVSNSGGNTISSPVQPQVVLAPLAGQPAPACHTQLTRPTTGTPVAALANLDSRVQAYLASQQTPAASLVVRYNGVVVLERGYGWQDFTCTRPMPYNGIFRLASLSKPLTRVAVRKAVTDGRLQLSDHIFCLQGSPSNCILDMRSESAADPRMADITVQQLIDHTSGWDAQQIQDPFMRDIEIAAARGVSSPPSKTVIARFIVSSTPLNNAPGSSFSYLNFGYMLLGMAIEAKTGQSFTAYAQSAVLNPLGLGNGEAMLSRTQPAQRDAREPWYSDPRVDAWVNVFDTAGPVVKFPDGGAAWENLDAAGGLSFSARAYSRFMSAYWMSGYARDGGNQSWNFFGSLPGTFTFAYQSGPIDLVLLTNQRQLDLGGPDDEAIKGIVETALAQVSAWPTTAPAGHQP